MIVVLDTNVLISSFLTGNKIFTNILETTDTLYIDDYVINEFETVLENKFKENYHSVRAFLDKVDYTRFKIVDVQDGSLFKIRDPKDYKVLYDAIMIDADILITGDKDFKDINISKPKIMTPREYYEFIMKED